MAAAALDLADDVRMTACPDPAPAVLVCRRSTASARSRRATTWLAAARARHVRPRGRRLLVLTSKVVSKAEGGSRRDARGGAPRGDRPGRRQARSTPRSCAPTTGWSSRRPGSTRPTPLPARSCCCRSTPTRRRVRLREALARPGRAQRRGHRHRHRRAGLAHRPDRHRHRCGRARRGDDHAGRTDPTATSWSSRPPPSPTSSPPPPTWSRASWTGDRPRWSAAWPDWFCQPGAHGPGAAALVRDESQDMFGLGAREAVLAALRAADARGFGSPCPAGELVAELAALPVHGGVADIQRGDGAVTVRLSGTARRARCRRGDAFARPPSPWAGAPTRGPTTRPPRAMRSCSASDQALRRLGDRPAGTGRRPREDRGRPTGDRGRPLEHGQVHQGPGPPRVVEQMRREQKRAEKRRTVLRHLRLRRGRPRHRRPRPPTADQAEQAHGGPARRARRRRGVGRVPGPGQEEGRPATRSTTASGTPITYARRPAGVRPALPDCPRPSSGSSTPPATAAARVPRAQPRARLHPALVRRDRRGRRGRSSPWSRRSPRSSRARS